MIELTKDRLEEACFFLGQLRQHKPHESNQADRHPSSFAII
jgi:hypothetical protein